MSDSRQPKRLLAHASQDGFIGRERELALLERLLTVDGRRLVTLTGPGGVGKTRLANEAVRRLEERFPEGIVSVDLLPLTRSEGILPAVAAVAGITGNEERLPELMKTELADRRCLLLLDNLEHLLPDAAAPIAWLLDGCPRLTILATGRRATHMAPELAIAVEPFPTFTEPVDDATAVASEAVRLFLYRATGAYARFRLHTGDAAIVAELCARVDGLPLAIELLAGWSVVLSPAQMLEQWERRLVTRNPTDDPRHRRMRDAVAWSESLLAPEMQVLFRRLAICRGGFALDLAERLARGRAAGAGYPFADGYDVPWFTDEIPNATASPGDHQDPAVALPLAPIAVDPVEGLAALIDHGLVRRGEGADGEPRFDMLDTIRAYGLERLNEEGELPAVAHAHAAAMAAFCEATGEGMWRTGRRLWSRARVDRELPNIRTALEWTTGIGPAGAELAIRIAGPLWIYWQTRGLVTEGRRWLEAALRHPTSPVWCRASHMPALGFLCWVQGDDARAVEVLTAALPIAAESGIRSHEGSIHFYLALVAWRAGPGAIVEMLEHLDEADRRYRESGNETGQGVCQLVYGLIARMTGDGKQALALFDEARRLHAEVGYEWGLATADYLAGETLRELAKDAPDRLPEAERLLRRALESYWAQGDLWGSGSAVSALARIAAERGEDERAARLFGAADAMMARVGSSLLPTEVVSQQATADALRMRMGPDAYAAAERAGRAMGMVDAVAEALADEESTAKQADPLANLTTIQRQMLRQMLEHFPRDDDFNVKTLVTIRGRDDSSIYGMLTAIACRLGLAHWSAVLPWVRAHAASQLLGMNNLETRSPSRPDFQKNRNKKALP